MFKITVICLTFFIFASPALFGEELTVGVGLFEPFFIKENKSGVFLDLIKETFTRMPQYEANFLFMSNRRLLRDLSIGKTDAAANIFKGSEVKAFLSEPLFRYTDVAVTLKNRNFIINKISDLQDKSIAAYEKATVLLGDEFRKMAKSNPGV